jgi:hypothetical protein
MGVSHSIKRWKMVVLVSSMLCYVCLYFLTSDYEVFQSQGDLIRIRLFKYSWHMTSFRPLLAIESALRGESFSWQVANHASVPPSLGATHMHLVLPNGFRGRIEAHEKEHSSMRWEGFRTYTVPSTGTLSLESMPATEDLSVTWEYSGHAEKPKGVSLYGPYITKDGILFYLGTKTDGDKFASVIDQTNLNRSERQREK